MRYATRTRRKIVQASLVPLEVLSCRLATEAYGMIPGDGPVHRLRGYLPGAAVASPAPPHDHRSPRPAAWFVGTGEGRKRGSVLWEAFGREVLTVLPEAALCYFGYVGVECTDVRRGSAGEVVRLE